MSNELQIYRKRLIPEECILLKDDIIVEQNEDYILTKWKTLNPKTTFSHGCSCYYLKEGFKISKFYRHDGSLLYWYCDIVEYTSRPEDNSLIVTDLLADIILYPDGRMHVVDLDELAEALEKGLITQAQMTACLRCGRCGHVCPIGLVPQMMAEAAERKDYERYEKKLYGLDCIACGSCTYICPAKRPLMQLFKQTKATIMAAKRK